MAILAKSFLALVLGNLCSFPFFFRLAFLKNLRCLSKCPAGTFFLTERKNTKKLVKIQLQRQFRYDSG
jgi:hypothetical protein